MPQLAETLAGAYAGLPALPRGVGSDLLAFGVPPWEKVVRTVLVYVAILLIIRVAGKRLMAQMNSQDLVVVLLLSNVVQNAIIGNDNSLAGGVLGAVVLVAVNTALDRWAMVSPRVAWLVDGKPTVVVVDGVADHRALRRLGMTQAELLNALQQQGADGLAEVRSASMEPGGTLTVQLQPEARDATVADLRRAVDALTAKLDTLGPGHGSPA
ncbi:DUF421 domain-containing protein [Phycicoccus sp. M110.8]|uniref:DUF421 domain-containing protein n=1 Tax=Phycicoccus sp. M110.8 TaxID=3075433 RepID=UPI0028FCFC9B|nr:YetF domain-containing protein [Phycicoccus sp. M110.8]MDU0313782.1 DUF421 domain-containing protein [Phycicoccus sp. M110.8]HET8766437.1 YetF domain-containing protein [Pedococcus sp.]